MVKLLQFIRIERERRAWLRGIGPVALVLAISATLLVGSGGASARQSEHPGVGAGTVRSAPRVRLARVDLHIETLSQGKDMEVNIALTQTENDCQAPLNDGLCLRYSVIEDENAISAGYGVVPASDVKVTAQAIMLQVDTSKVPGFTQVAGAGLSLSVTWQVGRQMTDGRAPAGQTAASLAVLLPPTTALGTVGTFVIPGAGPGTSLIATMLMQ